MAESATAAMGMAGFDLVTVVADPRGRPDGDNRVTDWPVPGPGVDVLEPGTLPSYVTSLMSDGVFAGDADQASARFVAVIGRPPR